MNEFSSLEKENSVKGNKDFTVGNLLKKMILYAIPLFLTAILQLLFTTIDLFTVNQFGEGTSSSAAIGATGSLTNLLICVCVGLCAGTAVIVGNARGGKNLPKAEKAIGSSLIIILSFSIVIAILGYFFARPLLELTHAKEELIDKSTTYVQVYFMGCPIILLYNYGASVLRALGDSKRPLIAISISGVINVGLDIALVVGAHMDVLGVAIATIASQVVAATFVMLVIIFDKRLFANLKLKRIRIYKEESLDVIKIGLASGLSSALFNISNVIVQATINQLPLECVYGNAASSNIEGYVYHMLNAISETTLVAISQNYGANNKERINKSLKYGFLMELIAVTIFAALVAALYRPLLSILIKPEEGMDIEAAYQYGLIRMLIVGLPYALCGMQECMSASMRGMKHSLAPALIQIIGIVGLRLILIYTLYQIPALHNFYFLMSIYPLSWILCIIIEIPIRKRIMKKEFTEVELVMEIEK